MPDPAWLLEHRRDVFSQAGEDGIVERSLELIPERDAWCVEFGASDGIYLSNSRNLIVHQSYSAILIEGDPARFARLRTTYASNPKVSTIEGMVGFLPEDGLDSILAGSPIPRDFDFLSIDIDGNDSHVWRALRRYEPKLVCIEFNPTVPPGVTFEQAADPDLQQGSSLDSINILAKEKGYELVAVLPSNAFFVQKRYFRGFGISDNRPEVLRKDLSAVTYLFSGYDGSVFLRGNRTLPWHLLPLREERMQVLPKVLRRYPSRYGRLHRLLLALVLLLKDRPTLFRKVARARQKAAG